MLSRLPSFNILTALGLATYLACVGLQLSPLSIRPLDLLRWSAGITLMWASIEKWAYPQWSFPVFVSHPGMSFGFDIAFYMRAAGVVEFALAFALLGTPLVRRSAAIILAAMFTAAIAEFGFIDGVGHSCIIAALLGVLADDARGPVRRWTTLMLPLNYSAALATFLVAYYGLHTVMLSGGGALKAYLTRHLGSACPYLADDGESCCESPAPGCVR